MANKDEDKKQDKKAEAAPASEEKKAEAPRQSADPRLRYIKRFHGRFLPRGPLRDRHKELFDRWNSGDDHGGVTVEELKSLYDDWMADRAKRAKKPVEA